MSQPDPDEIPRNSIQEAKRIVKPLIREELRKRELLPAAGSAAWPERTELLKRLADHYPKSKDLFRVTSWSTDAFSTTFGSPEDSLPKPNIETIKKLYLAICEPEGGKEAWSTIVRQAMNHLDAAAVVQPKRPQSSLHHWLYIPPTIDGLLLGLDHLTNGSGRSTKKSGKGANDEPTAELDPLLYVEVRKPRFEELSGEAPPRFKRDVPFYYMSWQKVLDAQEVLSRGKTNDEVLVLSNWGMVTAPSYCLLKRGDPEYLANQPTLLSSESERARTKKLAKALERGTLIRARRSTASASFDVEFARLKSSSKELQRKQPVSVSRVTPLLELINARTVPEDWIVVAGPPQFWTVRRSRACHILDAAEERASEIHVGNHHSRYVIATRRNWLHENDPEGVTAAGVFHRLGLEVRDGFNHRNQHKQKLYRKRKAERLLEEYQAAEGPDTGIDESAILDFIDIGMKLEIGKNCGFIPVLDYDPGNSKS